jgi:mannose PTS system EIIA component
MSVGLLILSHDGIGSSILGTAMQMVTECPFKTKLLSVEQDNDPEELIAHTSILIEELDSGEGVLILTDLYGSTPSNIATACATNAYVSAIAGLNLSMLIKVMNYPDLSLSELAGKAISGGQQGIAQIRTTTNNHADETSNNNK